MPKRHLTIRWEKKNEKVQTAREPFVDQMQFENKTDHILSRLESTGAKMFLGVCAYIVLDTFRQVQVAKAANPNN